MCRWIAYSGAPIYLDELLFNADHSLIDQSLKAHSSETTTNGDGFGIGWYGDRETPGVYKDVRPAWNDSNLHAIAAQIKSRLFLAHVRAATGTEVQRSNCHPFQYKQWIFVHNGEVNDFHKIKRDLALAVSAEFYPFISGTTDSEIMFFLALTFGMTDDVAGGISRMAGFIDDVCRRHGIDNGVQMSLGISNGQSIYAFRYSTEGRSRSLFHSTSVEAIKELAPEAARFSPDARVIVSEPLSDLAEAWVEVPESSFVELRGGEVTCGKFELIAP